MNNLKQVEDVQHHDAQTPSSMEISELVADAGQHWARAPSLVDNLKQAKGVQQHDAQTPSLTDVLKGLQDV